MPINYNSPRVNVLHYCGKCGKFIRIIFGVAGLRLHEVNV